MRIPKALAALAAVSCLVPFGASHAGLITTYNTLGGWEVAAGSPVVLEDFSDATIVPGITFASGSVGLAFLDDAPAPGDPFPAGIDFSPGITALSADWILNTNVNQLGIFAEFVDGTTSAAVLVNQNPGNVYQAFFGFVFSVPVTNITYIAGSMGGLFVMDNIRFVPAADDGTVSVPEPATLSLMTLSLLGLFGGRAFRRA